MLTSLYPLASSKSAKRLSTLPVLANLRGMIVDGIEVILVQLPMALPTEPPEPTSNDHVTSVHVTRRRNETKKASSSNSSTA